MILVTDQIGREVCLQHVPKRIISLVPSQTELLVDLGLEQQIVGLTKFCVHPKGLKASKRVVGGTKKVNFEVIEALNPDIILCNKEENTKDIVETLALKYPVHVSDIYTLQDTYKMLMQYGVLFDCKDKAENLIVTIKKEAEVFTNYNTNKSSKKVAYIIWKNPWMVAGNHTFIDHMLSMNGFENAFRSNDRYPEIREEDLQDPDIDLILLSSEPFPFGSKHLKELQNQVSEHTKVVLVDGECFSWYGSRLLRAFSYFKDLHKAIK